MDESCILYYFSRVTWLVDWWLDQRVFRVMMNRMNRKKESCESWWIAWIEKESLASHHESYESKTRVLRVIMFCMTRLTSHDKSWWLDLTRPSLFVQNHLKNVQNLPWYHKIIIHLRGDFHANLPNMKSFWKRRYVREIRPICNPTVC